jgi:predicted DCC family thiol-disulfide oxidoreductase YuxK
MRRLRLSAEAVIPWQEADLDALGLTPEQCAAKLQWVGDRGVTQSGHLAIASLLEANGPWRPVGRLLRARWVSPLAARAYDWVSAHRMSLPGGTPACQLPPAK